MYSNLFFARSSYPDLQDLLGNYVTNFGLLYIFQRFDEQSFLMIALDTENDVFVEGVRNAGNLNCIPQFYAMVK